MKIITNMVCIAWCMTLCGVDNNQPWALLYGMHMNDNHHQMMQGKQAIVFEKQLRFPASQLIISWNIMRPRMGYYTVYVQALLNNSWTAWYKIAEWGAGMQRSFERLSSNGPSFCYVRFEMPAGLHTQACRIKVEAHDGASLDAIAHIAVSAADYQKFVPEYGSGKHFSLPSVMVHGVPTFSQMRLNSVDHDRMCSPTSVAMVLSYLMHHTIDPLAVARGVRDQGLNSYGSWAFNTAYAFDATNGAAFFMVTRLNNFADLYAYLRNKLPVVVSVRGPMRTMPPGKTYADGHLLVVVGWNDKTKRVICNDPAFSTDDAVRHSYDINDFLAAWERSYRLAYVVRPR